jgi:hypothetical protein
MRVSIIRAVIWNRYYVSIFLFPSVFFKSRERFNPLVSNLESDLILLFQI